MIVRSGGAEASLPEGRKPPGFFLSFFRFFLRVPEVPDFSKGYLTQRHDKHCFAKMSAWGLGENGAH